MSCRTVPTAKRICPVWFTSSTCNYTIKASGREVKHAQTVKKSSQYESSYSSLQYFIFKFTVFPIQAYSMGSYPFTADPKGILATITSKPSFSKDFLAIHSISAIHEMNQFWCSWMKGTTRKKPTWKGFQYFADSYFGKETFWTKLKPKRHWNTLAPNGYLVSKTEARLIQAKNSLKCICCGVLITSWWFTHRLSQAQAERGRHWH